ncbi:hypothetical protein R6Q59_015287 [Mikania micrantha]
MKPHIQIVNQPPIKSKLHTFFATTYFILFHSVTHIFTLATKAIHGGIITPLCHLWPYYYPRIAFMEQRVVMPHSSISFIVNGLLVFVEIKSQGQPGFPFKTHPTSIMFSVTSLLMYGLFCATEFVVYEAIGDPTSVYVIITHLGKICSLYILVASLAYLFYF